MSLKIDSSCTDTLLISSLAKGDKLAFELLYTRYWEELYLTAFSVLKNEEASKDIVQEVFIWLWVHRKEVEIKTVKYYLQSAVKYKVANYIRSLHIRESFFEQLSNFSSSEMNMTVEESIEIKELDRFIQQEVCALPKKCGQIFRLSREERLSNREIAEKLLISPKTVENQMTIALRHLRKAIKPSLINILLIEIFFSI